MSAEPVGHQPVSAVRVTGMTCTACERRVTRALLALPGVTAVEASAARGRVTLTGERPADDELRAALDAAGYRLGTPPWLTRDRRAWTTATAAAATLGVAGWLAGRGGVQVPVPDGAGAGSGAALTLALLVGLAAGVSTCMALVGGLVLALSASGATSTATAAAAGRAATAPTRGAALRPHLVFTLGRLAGFAVGGAALGTLGAAARPPAALVAVLGVVVAGVMALLGLRLTDLSPRLAGFSVTLPARWADRLGLRTDRGALLAGAATFVLPCGFTQAMQLYAVSLGSPGLAAGVMAAFALGTAPGLLGLGSLGVLGSSAGSRGLRTPVRLAGVVVLAFAVVTGGGELRALGVPLPRLPGGDVAALATGSVSPNVTLDGDVQVVTMTQTAHGYVPADTTVWAGVPIRWEIRATAGFSCSSSLRMPSARLAVDLTREGTHVVDVPALRVGTSRFSCLMGMYGGSFRAIPRETA